MLIKIKDLYKTFNINIIGILHIGAHNCEELEAYISVGIDKDDIYWVEGQENLVKKMKDKGIKNIFHALIDEEDDKEVIFNISNNGQSSSLLEFGTHSKNHPEVKYVSKSRCKTIRLDTLIEKKNIPIKKLNFLNIDIQGLELRALKSIEKYLLNIDYIYTEVNIEEVYKHCAKIEEIDEYLNKFGFIRVDVKIYKQCGWGDAFYMRNINN